MKKQSETDLVKACLAWLKVAKPAGVFWRANVGAVVSEYQGRKRFTRFGVPGMADIQGILNGRAVFIECKSAKGVLSANQIVFGERVSNAGALYLVVRSLDELIQKLP